MRMFLSEISISFVRLAAGCLVLQDQSGKSIRLRCDSTPTNQEISLRSGITTGCPMPWIYITLPTPEALQPNVQPQEVLPETEVENWDPKTAEAPRSALEGSRLNLRAQTTELQTAANRRPRPSQSFKSSNLAESENSTQAEQKEICLSLLSLSANSDPKSVVVEPALQGRQDRKQNSSSELLLIVWAPRLQFITYQLFQETQTSDVCSTCP